MSQVTPREPLAPQVAARLTDFARACKAATRAVSLYPDGHPAIAASLARLVETAGRAVQDGALTIKVKPGLLLVDDRAPARPDAALGELAALLHDHLVGEIRLEPGMSPEGWRVFLRLLAQPPTDVQAQGGIARLWIASGGQHLDIRELDYAEVMRAREAGIAAGWDAILDHCLRTDAIDLDEQLLQALLAIAADPARLAELVGQLTSRAEAGGARGQTEALLRLLRQIADSVVRHTPDAVEEMLGNIAGAASQLSPEVMLELMTHRYEAPPDTLNVVDGMLTRMTDVTVSQFVARSILEQRGATERLAEAFQALVPDEARRQRLLGLARTELEASPIGSDETFPDLWQRASDMLTSYHDEPFVSGDYAAELSSARAHAADVERIADDPPERIAAWLSTISDAAVRSNDLQLLVDLLRIEDDPKAYETLLGAVAAHLDDLVLLGDLPGAVALATALAGEARPAHRAAARRVLDRLVAGPLLANLVAHLRTVDDETASHARGIALALGHAAIRPLADALVAEERGRAFRRLTDLIVAFGKAGRDAAEHLKKSANPAVRRTAILLLREFGGNEALPDLLTLLDDADPNVQREAVRAIAIIGSDQAFAALQQALTSGNDRRRETIVSALGSVRDERAVPLLCQIVSHDDYRRSARAAWLAAVEGLGAAAAPAAVAVLREALPRGEWWSPGRTAETRRAVAVALRKIGTPDAVRALEQAAQDGPRGARTAAREQLTQVRGEGGERSR